MGTASDLQVGFQILSQGMVREGWHLGTCWIEEENCASGAREDQVHVWKLGSLEDFPR